MMSGGQRRAGLPAAICNQLDPQNLANAGSDKQVNRCNSELRGLWQIFLLHVVV